MTNGPRYRVFPLDPGGWMAVTLKGARVPVGVFGDTEDEAKQRMTEALRIRDEMHATQDSEAPLPQRTDDRGQ